MKNIAIKSEFIKLDSFLKWCGSTQTGGEAKLLISEGKILVNDEVELRRGRKLRPGDRVQICDDIFLISGE